MEVSGTRASGQIPPRRGCHGTHPVYLKTRGPPGNTGFLAVSSPVSTPTALSCGGTGAPAGQWPFSPCSPQQGAPQGQSLSSLGGEAVTTPMSGEETEAWATIPRVRTGGQVSGLSPSGEPQSTRPLSAHGDCLAIQRAEDGFVCPHIPSWGGSCGFALSPSVHQHQWAQLPGPVLDLGDPGLGTPPLRNSSQ